MIDDTDDRANKTAEHDRPVFKEAKGLSELSTHGICSKA